MRSNRPFFAFALTFALLLSACNGDSPPANSGLKGEPQTQATDGRFDGAFADFPQRDLEEALKSAKKRGVPVGVLVMRENCPNCEIFMQQTWPDPEVQKVLREELELLVPSDLGMNFYFSRYGNLSAPSLLVIDLRGNAIGKVISAEKDDFVRNSRSLIAKSKAD